MGGNELILLPIAGCLVAVLVMLRTTRRHPAPVPEVTIRVKAELDTESLEILGAHMDTVANRIERAAAAMSQARAQVQTPKTQTRRKPRPDTRKSK